MQKSGHLTLYILLAMILGIVVGFACHSLWPDPKTAANIASYISLVTDLFLRLIKMIIAPLVFSTLVVGIAHMGDSKTVGRVGLKTMGWFITASLLSLGAWAGYGLHPAPGRKPRITLAGRQCNQQSENLFV